LVYECNWCCKQTEGRDYIYTLAYALGILFPAFFQKETMISPTAAKMYLAAAAHKFHIKIQVLDQSEDAFCIRVVSQHFKTVHPIHRSTILEHAFRKHVDQLMKHYTLIIEAYTPEELVSMGEEFEETMLFKKD
jgi:hypothetical protein